MEKIILVYGILMLIGLIGHYVANSGKRIMRIGLYLPLCFGQYIYLRTNMAGFSEGGRYADQIPALYKLTELLFVFPVLGAINVLLTTFYLLFGFGYILSNKRKGVFETFNSRYTMAIGRNGRVMRRAAKRRITLPGWI